MGRGPDVATAGQLCRLYFSTGNIFSLGGVWGFDRRSKESRGCFNTSSSSSSRGRLGACHFEKAIAPSCLIDRSCKCERATLIMIMDQPPEPLVLQTLLALLSLTSFTFYLSQIIGMNKFRSARAAQHREQRWQSWRELSAELKCCAQRRCKGHVCKTGLFLSVLFPHSKTFRSFLTNLTFWHRVPQPLIIISLVYNLKLFESQKRRIPVWESTLCLPTQPSGPIKVKHLLRTSLWSFLKIYQMAVGCNGSHDKRMKITTGQI